jgi:hypothetical protein
MYRMTSEFIPIILKYGKEPIFRNTSDNTEEIQLSIKLIVQLTRSHWKRIYSHKLLFYMNSSFSNTQLLNLHLQDRSNLILHNFEKRAELNNWNSYGPGTTIENFRVCLPLQLQETLYKAVSLSEYFDFVQEGKVSFHPLYKIKL